MIGRIVAIIFGICFTIADIYLAGTYANGKRKKTSSPQVMAKASAFSAAMYGVLTVLWWLDW